MQRLCKRALLKAGSGTLCLQRMYKKINHCTIAYKYTYNARFANRKYREKLRDSRAGINMTKRELHQKDKIISPLIEQGQLPYHILITHPELDMSVRTLYSYLDQ